jgi:ribosomal protein L37E
MTRRAVSRACGHPSAQVTEIRWRPVSEHSVATGCYAHGVCPGTMLWWFAGDDEPDARVCKACGEWLPLGPSNDAPDEVRVEMRAAMLAARPGFGSFHNHGAGCERCGFVANKHNTDATHLCKSTQFHTGWLAYAITDHDRITEHGNDI